MVSKLMDNKDSNLEKNGSIESYLNKLNEILIKAHPETKVTMKWLVWWILKYTSNWISSRFFWLEKNTIHEEDILSFIEYAQWIEDDLTDMLKEISKKTMSEDMKVFLSNKIVEQLTVCLLSQYAVYFEAEKWASTFKLSEEQTQYYLKKVEETSEKIRWWKIVERPWERDWILKYLWSLEDESWILSWFLNEFWDQGDTTSVIEKTYDSELLGKMINRDDYMTVFEKNFNLQWFDVIFINESKEVNEVKQVDNSYTFPYGTSSVDMSKYLLEKWVYSKEKHVKTIHTFISEKWNMSATTSPLFFHSWIKLPTNSDYDAISVEKLCVYLDHEQATHASRGHWMVEWIKQTSAWYLSTEEWIAMTNEHLVFNSPQSLDVLNPTEHNVTKLICEIYGSEKAIPVIEAYYKATKKYLWQEKKKAIARVERLKRYWPSHIPYALAKDNAYNIYTEAFIKELLNVDVDELDDIVRKLYSWKRSKDELWIIPWLNKEIWVDHKEVKLPIMVWKLLAVKASWIDHKLLTDKESPHYDPRFMLDRIRTRSELRQILQIENIIHERAYVA